MISATWKLQRFFPEEDRLLPMKLGNILRAAEDMPEIRYGLDAVLFWPRLYPLLPRKITNILNDSRNQLDSSLYRFDLLRSLHLPLPTDRKMEKMSNQELSLFLHQGVLRNDLIYDHKRAEDLFLLKKRNDSGETFEEEPDDA